MGIQVICGHCGTVSLVEDHQAGARVACTFCQGGIDVPAAGAAIDDPAPAIAVPPPNASSHLPAGAAAQGPVGAPALSHQDIRTMERVRRLIRGLRFIQATLIQIAALMGVSYISSLWTVSSGWLMGLLVLSAWVCCIVGSFMAASGAAGRRGAALGTWAGILFLSPVALLVIGLPLAASGLRTVASDSSIELLVSVPMDFAGPTLLILFVCRMCLDFGRPPLAQQCVIMLVGLLAVEVETVIAQVINARGHILPAYVGPISIAAKIGLNLWLFIILRNLNDHLKRFNPLSLRDPQAAPAIQPQEWMQRPL